MAKSPFKMKGFSGFVEGSPLKQKEFKLKVGEGQGSKREGKYTGKTKKLSDLTPEEIKQMKLDQPMGSPVKQRAEGETRKEYRSRTKEAAERYLGEGASKRDIRKTARQKRKIDRNISKYEKAQEKRTGQSSYVGESGSKKEVRIEKRIRKAYGKAEKTKKNI